MSTVLLTLSLWLAFAPAPLARPRPAGPPPECVVVWGGSRWRTWFDHGGHYRCVGLSPGYHQRWVGTWMRNGRVVTVRERLECDPPEMLRLCWSLHLDEDAAAIHLER